MLQNPHERPGIWKKVVVFRWPSNAGHLIRGLDILNNLPKDQASWWADKGGILKKVHGLLREGSEKNGIPHGILVGPWGNWQIESQFIALRIKNVVSEDTLQKRGAWLYDGRRESWATDLNSGVGILGIDSTDCKCWWSRNGISNERPQCIRRKGIQSHGSSDPSACMLRKLGMIPGIQLNGAEEQVHACMKGRIVSQRPKRCYEYLLMMCYTIQHIQLSRWVIVWFQRCVDFQWVHF